MASGRNFVFSAKEQVWLVICVGNRAQYHGFRIKDVGWDRKNLKGLDLKNVQITVYHIMSEYACLV